MRHALPVDRLHAQGRSADLCRRGTPAAPPGPPAACPGSVSGYACGGPGEPGDDPRRPYFRQANNATRGQIAMIVYGVLTSGEGCVLHH
jgi:hypothetical protein